MADLEIIDGELTTIGHSLADASDEVNSISGIAGAVSSAQQAMPGAKAPGRLTEIGTTLDDKTKEIADKIQEGSSGSSKADQMFTAADEEHEQQFAGVSVSAGEYAQ